MADFNEYKGVWVFCEQRQGALMPTDFELVSERGRCVSSSTSAFWATFA